MVFPGPPCPMGQGSWAHAAVSAFLTALEARGPLLHTLCAISYSRNILLIQLFKAGHDFSPLSFSFFHFSFSSFFFLFFSWIMHSCNTSCGVISNAMELPCISHSLCMHKALLFHRSASGPGLGSSHFSHLAFQRRQHWASQEVHPAWAVPASNRAEAVYQQCVLNPCHGGWRC